VKNDLAVRANVKVIADIMDPAVQLVWLHFSQHVIGSATQGATLGAFVLGGIYREWTPLLNREESMQRLGLLQSQISKAAEHGAQVVLHGDFNVDLDRAEDKGYYMGAMVTSLAECTTSAGLETHITDRPEFRFIWQFPSARSRPKSGGRPPKSDQRGSTTCRRWSKSRRRLAKSCRRLPQVRTSGPRVHQGAHF
jgi:hypothetical protein